MANKRISELSSRTPSATDLMLVGDPTTGYSYKCLVSQVGGVTSVFGRTGVVTAQEGDYSLTLLSDVTITAPTVDQVLIYNGTSWVNAENYSNKTQHLVKLGAAIGKGKAVYVSGASGTNIIVNLSSNDSEATSSKVLGLTASAGALNDMVYVITEGLLPGIDTSGSTAGDPVWLGTSGNLIFGGANRPVPPLNAVYLGVVTRVSATVGEVFIRVQNGFELEELHDVKFTSLANNHALVYNSTSQLWENKVLSTTNVTEGTNLYYTDARARGAISLTTTGSGAATYNSSTGVLNIPTPSSVNIYNADGTLTGNRTVTMGAFDLVLTGDNIPTLEIRSTGSTFSTDFSVLRLSTAARTWSMATGGTTTTFNGAFYIDYPNSSAVPFRINTDGTTNLLNTVIDNQTSITNLTVNSNISTGYSVINIRNSATSGRTYQIAVGGNGTPSAFANNLYFADAVGGTRMTLFSTGNFAINTTTDAGFRLDVNGTMRVQGQLTVSNNILLTWVSGSSITVKSQFNNRDITISSNGRITMGESGASFASGSQSAYYLPVVGNIRGFAVMAQGSENYDIAPLHILNNRIELGQTSLAVGNNPLQKVIAQFASANDWQLFGSAPSNYAGGLQMTISGGLSGSFVDVNNQGAAGLLIVKGGDAQTTATNINTAGGNIQVSGGRGTGTGTPGDVIFSTSTATTTGTTLQTLTNRWWVKGGTGQLANLSTPDASAIFQLNSTTRGVLLPRMTTTQRNAIASPATGLMVYDTTGNNLDYYNGTQWLDVLASDFLTIDNTNNRLGINDTTPGRTLSVTGTMGTTDNTFLAINSGAYAGVGATSDANYKFNVDGKLRVYGAIRTSAPSGGTEMDWKLGNFISTTVQLDTTGYIEVEVNGTAYKLALASLP